MKWSTTRLFIIALLASNFLTVVCFAAARSCNLLFLDIPKQTESVPPVVKDLDQLIEQIKLIEERLRGTSEYLSPRIWREMSADFGLPGLDLPKRLGGSNFSASRMVQVFEFMGRYSLDMRDMIGGGHSRALVESKNPEQLEVIKQAAKGKAYTAIAITEPEAGSNMRAMTSKSERTKDGYFLTGQKSFNARLENSTHVIVFTRASNQDSATTKLNAFLLPIDYPGLRITSLKAHGLFGNSFGGVSFDNMFVSNKYLIGKDGDGGKIFREHFQYWRLMRVICRV